jgi:mannose-6-phosphate isomerase class I
MQIETRSRALEDFGHRPRLVRLECGIQHYDWGDPDAIPSMLGAANPGRRPYAELWAGAHPDLPAIALIEGVRVPLNELVAGAPEKILGKQIADRFAGELPFLLKILAAGKPLSIQAHPNDRQAQAGFERENRAGLALDAATRSYHDPHHKPELLVALTDFFALRGFRSPEDIESRLAEIPELETLATFLRGQPLRPDAASQQPSSPRERDSGTGDPQSPGRPTTALEAIYAHVMHLDQERVNDLLSPLIERLAREDRRNPFPPTSREYWLLRADREYSAPGYRDPGLFSVLLLNLVRLRPGQAMFLPAGELHAYLQGVGVELMANSNNVLRGGLTHKYVDVDELLRTLSFRAAPPQILQGLTPPDEPDLTSYPTPAGEFALCRLDLPAGRTFERSDGELALILLSAGGVQASQAVEPPVTIVAGQALLAPAGVSWSLLATKDAVCWLARVPPENADVG